MTYAYFLEVSCSVFFEIHLEHVLQTSRALCALFNHDFLSLTVCLNQSHSLILGFTDCIPTGKVTITYHTCNALIGGWSMRLRPLVEQQFSQKGPFNIF